MAVRAGNLFALDGLGTSGTGIYDAVCKCIWGQEKSDFGIWKGRRPFSPFECIVVCKRLWTGNEYHTFGVCMHRTADVRVYHTVCL